MLSPALKPVKIPRASQDSTENISKMVVDFSHSKLPCKLLGADDSEIDMIIKGHWSAVHLVPQAYFETQPHVGERLLSDEGLVVLLLNIENGVAGLKWYRQSLLTLLSSSFCLVLDPGTPGAQHVGNFTAHGNPELRSALEEKISPAAAGNIVRT